MIGSTLARVLNKNKNLNIIGIGRKALKKESVQFNYLQYPDLLFENSIGDLFKNFKPDVIINCAGLTKHLSECQNSNKAVEVNSLIPKNLSSYCKINNCKLIHISTDCVFDGAKGNYSEDDLPNAKDIYGISKSLGESIYHHNLVIRTSTIGHEINTKHGLLEWFISQNSYCTGYRNAYFSGITTLELAYLINDFILKKINLIGLFNVSSEKISKYELLSKINEIYKLKKKIIISDQQKIDRSLNSYKFNRVFGYYPNSWDKMIVSMYKDWCHKY